MTSSLKKIICILASLYTTIPVTASHMAEPLPLSTPKTQAKQIHISVPSQLTQWLDNGIKRIDDCLLAEAEQCFSAITDPDQQRLVIAIFTKRFEICEFFFTTCWTGVIKKLELLDTLNKELQILHRQTDAETYRALSNLDTFLEQHEEWSSTSAKQYINGIIHLAQILKKVTQYALKTGTNVMDAVNSNLRATNQEICVIDRDAKKQSLRNLLSLNHKINQQAHTNQDSDVSNTAELLAKLDNMPLFDIDQVKYLLKQAERAARPASSKIGTHMHIFRTAQTQLEELKNQISGLLKERINFIEIHAYLAQAYLRANHTAVIVNHLCRELTQKNRSKNRYNQILYPLQLIVDEIHNGHDNFNVRALETVVKNTLETVSIEQITIHITNKVETLLDTTRELENGLQFLGGREAADLLFTLEPDNDVCLQAKKAALNAIREQQKEQIHELTAACTTKTTKKMLTALRYYTSLVFSRSVTESSQTEKATHLVSQLTGSRFALPRSSTQYLLCFLECCTDKVILLEEEVPRNLPKKINAQLSELVKSYASDSDEQISIEDKIKDDARIMSLVKQLRPIWQEKSTQPKKNNLKKQKITGEHATGSQKVKKKRRGKYKRQTKACAQSKIINQDNRHRGSGKQHTVVHTGDESKAGKIEEHGEGPVDAKPNGQKKGRDLCIAAQSVVSAGKKSARHIRLSLKEYLQKVESAFKKYFPETQVHTIGSHRCIHYRRDFSAGSPCVTLYLGHENQSNQIVSIPDMRRLEKAEDRFATNWDFYHSFPTTVDQLIPELAQQIDADNPLLAKLDIRLEPGQNALVIRAKIFTDRRDPGLLANPEFFTNNYSAPFATLHDGYVVYLIATATNSCFHRQFHPLKTN